MLYLAFKALFLGLKHLTCKDAILLASEKEMLILVSPPNRTYAMKTFSPLCITGIRTHATDANAIIVFTQCLFKLQ